METHTLEEFRNKFKVEESLILSAGSWSWSVRPWQPTLGSGIISLNRYALHLSEVTSEEMAEFSELVKTIECAMKSLFDYSIMNYLMLMMVDHHVHYHIIPRYSSSRRFAGREWVDKGWASFPVLSDNQHPEAIGLIKDSLIRNITN